MNNRIGAIDFAKGTLVLFMVIYHSLNYLGYDSIPHYCLLFVPPSFIMIAGFIITHVYVPRYGLTSRNIVSILILRSCKLVLLFTLLNIGAAVVFSSQQRGGAISLSNFIRGWIEIYIMGGSRWAAFEVLLPIGYLLFLAIPILRLQSLFPYGIGGISLATVAVCLTMEHNGYPVYNLYLISAGTLGMAIGFLPSHNMKVVSYPWVVLGSFYALYWFAFLLFGDQYMIQLLATLVSVLLIYAVGSRIDLGRWLPGQALVLGQYSLLAYIIQILYLQIFKHLPIYGVFELPGLVVVIISIMILTWGTVRSVHYAREKSDFFDDAYRMIFA